MTLRIGIALCVCGLLLLVSCTGRGQDDDHTSNRLGSLRLRVGVSATLSTLTSSDGGLFVSGEAKQRDNARSSSFVAKVANGRLADDFSDDGVLVLPDDVSQPEDIVVQDDHKIVLVGAGGEAPVDNAHTPITLSRLEPSGERDQSFGTDGSVTIGLPAAQGESAEVVAATFADGRILVAARVELAASGGENIGARVVAFSVLLDGALYGGYGKAGFSSTKFKDIRSGGSEWLVPDAVFTRKGTLVLTGAAASGTAVVRCDSLGMCADPTVIEGAYRVVNSQGNDAWLASIEGPGYVLKQFADDGRMVPVDAKGASDRSPATPVAVFMSGAGSISIVEGYPQPGCSIIHIEKGSADPEITELDQSTSCAAVALDAAGRIAIAGADMSREQPRAIVQWAPVS